MPNVAKLVCLCLIGGALLTSALWKASAMSWVAGPPDGVCRNHGSSPRVSPLHHTSRLRKRDGDDMPGILGDCAAGEIPAEAVCLMQTGAEARHRARHSLRRAPQLTRTASGVSEVSSHFDPEGRVMLLRLPQLPISMEMLRWGLSWLAGYDAEVIVTNLARLSRASPLYRASYLTAFSLIALAVVRDTPMLSIGDALRFLLALTTTTRFLHYARVSLIFGFVATLRPRLTEEGESRAPLGVGEHDSTRA